MKTQPFMEDYFKDSDNNNRFYKGLPDSHLLKKKEKKKNKEKDVISFKELISFLFKVPLHCLPSSKVFLVPYD